MFTGKRHIRVYSTTEHKIQVFFLKKVISSKNVDSSSRNFDVLYQNFEFQRNRIFDIKARNLDLLLLVLCNTPILDLVSR